MNKEDKVTILLHLLNERYNAAHKIREKSFRLAIWILGVAVAFVWILVSGTPLILSQKWILTSLVIILGACTIWFLRSLEMGSHRNRKVMIDLESALGCYEKGLYVDSKALFPNEYKKNGELWASHFKSIYILIIPIAVLIIILIWFTPSDGTSNTHPDKIPHQSQIRIEKPDKSRL
jgi:ABC-type branched-subunit amino acid transport system permease subunit